MLKMILGIRLVGPASQLGRPRASGAHIPEPVIMGPRLHGGTTAA